MASKIPRPAPRPTPALDQKDPAYQRYRRRQRRKWRWGIVLVLFGWWFAADWPNHAMLAANIGATVLQFAFAALFMIFQFAALFWFLSRGRVYWIHPGETGFTWEDYRGNPQVVEMAKQVVTLLKGVQSFKAMGGEAIRGILLCGSPGTGKSFLAQVIANEAGIPFCYASAPGFQNMFFGVGNMRVMAIYRKARKMAAEYGSCIIFIDEIDAIGQKRGGAASGGLGGMMGGMMGGGVGLLNELLLQLDPPNVDSRWTTKLLRSLGFRVQKAERPAVLTLAATNIPEVLDPALLRPGRFDRTIRIDNPDYEGRIDVLQYYMAKVQTDGEIDARRCALDTIGYSPAQLKHVVNESVLLAHQRGSEQVTYTDFRRAMEAYEWGLRQPIRSMGEADKRRLAYHEAGHAVAQYLLKPKDQVWKVTIIRHGGALGLAATKPKEEQYHQSDSDMLASIQVCLASRAAEELFLNEKLGGVTEDLRQATGIAAWYLGAVGMGDELYSWRAGGSELEGIKALRPKINKLLSQEMEHAKTLLHKHADFTHAVAGALLEREELTGEEVAALFPGEEDS